MGWLTPLEPWSRLCVSVYSSFTLALPAILYPRVLSTVEKATFTLLSQVSTLHHAGYYHSYLGKDVVWWVDKGLSHTLALIYVRESLSPEVARHPATWVFWGSLGYIGYLYYVKRLVHIRGPVGDLWHGTMHVASVVGACALFSTRSLR